MTTGIYKYENKINGNIYIGQSSNIERRMKQHLYDAENRANTSTGLDVAIKKYGIENFNIEIIEECPIELLNEKEIYWIKYYDSYNNGYNRTIGGNCLNGENHPRALLTEDQVWEIREMYDLHIPKRMVFNLFKDTGISERGFKKIWDGTNWTGVHCDVYTLENKEWHKQATGHGEDQIGLSSLDRAIKQEEIDQWVIEYKNGMSINAIAKKYSRDNGTVEKYIANPQAIQKIKYNGRILKNVNTGKIFQSINKAAKWAGCGATTLTRHLAKDKIAGKVPDTGEPAEWIELL